MKLKDIFDKPIDRAIEGVIKADDTASLKIEVEEYVITNEVAKRLEEFFGAYNDYKGANGVWISGFFGSGKSHLLKMLALLLENTDVDGGKPVLDYFLPKCHDALLKADMKRAADTPSKSILFNIDQKADTISKTEVDAVLAVFVKVFNEMCGYYGKQGYVAQFERDLDNRGLYEGFKKAYEQLSGKKWEVGREQIILEKGNIAKAYSQVSGTAEEVNKNIVDAYRNDYKLSIEDFADQVNDYIKKQKPGFRLNFFVDEVGQYVADNVKLMTNLQTIAESLATKCKGQSWIIVTAQEDMKKVLGEINTQMENDFSKIQDRFKTRLKLTSQNVDEVIQKRLLLKNEKGETFIEKIYEKEKNNFGTLFEFTDGATIYKNFKDKKHFTDSYPFVPYQFSLFQASIENLSLHAAFEGKHSSVGERSMLGVFQEVAVEISDKDAGQLATFDRMYEGIRKALKAQIQRSVLNAENQLENDFAKRVLKALLLVKYIKGFNATPRNLRVLLQETFDQNVGKLLKNIEEALSLLEQQTYIQRNGDSYEYLTDEEKDVEEEIKNTEVDSGEVSKTLEDLLFAGVIRENKMRYELTGQDYPFTKKLDDKSVSREYELAVHFITPFSDNADDLTTLKSHSLGRPELMVVLPVDSRLVIDLLHFKKTEKYARLNRSSKQSASVISILDGKARQNDERFKLIQDRVRDLIGKAKFFVAGEAIEISGEDPKTRIVKGFSELVMRTYPNLRMLKSTNFDENDIRKHLDIAKGTLLSDSLTEPENEVLAFIKSNKSVGTRTTMKSVEENFTKKPYGWYLAAIQCIVAMLLGRGKVEARVDSNSLDGVELERALKNTHGFPHIILDPQSDVNPSELRRVKDFYNNFFDKPASANEAKALGLEVRTAFQEMLLSLKELHAQISQYSFLIILDAPIKTVQEFSGKEYAFYFTELPRRENELLDMKEATIDPIRAFMNGSNKTIYNDASKYLQTQSPNFSAMESDKPAELKALLDAPDCYKGNKMKEAKTLMDGLKKDVESHVKQARKDALAHVSKIQGQVQGMQEYSALKKEQKQEIEQSFEAITTYIQNENLISSIRDRAGRYETSDYSSLLTKITGWTQKDPEQKPVEYVSQSDLGVKFDKPYLSSDEDVEAYLEAVKKAMLKVIKNNKRIQL
jgi:hypothetical protein